LVFKWPVVRFAESWLLALALLLLHVRTTTSFAEPASSYLAVVLARALGGIQSPVGEKTEI
jgi:hypothetical protein